MRRQYLGEDFVDANLKERESMPHEGESLTEADPQQQSGLHSAAHICLAGVGCAGMEHKVQEFTLGPWLRGTGQPVILS